MIYENEVIMLMIGLGTLVFVLIKYADLKRIASFGILLAAFCVLIGGWTLTVLEHFFWESSLNFAEHACYAASCILLAYWCHTAFGKIKEGK